MKIWALPTLLVAEAVRAFETYGLETPISGDASRGVQPGSMIEAIDSLCWRFEVVKLAARCGVIENFSRAR